MNLIAFYISDHGYGHAARNIPIIKNMLSQDLNINIAVKSSVIQIIFMKQSLGQFSSRIAYYELNTDLGLILRDGSMAIDKPALYGKLNEFIETWDKKIEIEKNL